MGAVNIPFEMGDDYIGRFVVIVNRTLSIVFAFFFIYVLYMIIV